ncbi:MAG: hypothetical protein ACR2NZ_11755 [Rubripirellula sp.]
MSRQSVLCIIDGEVRVQRGVEHGATKSRPEKAKGGVPLDYEPPLGIVLMYQRWTFAVSFVRFVLRKLAIVTYTACFFSNAWST